jgi:hypothetical protein
VGRSLPILILISAAFGGGCSDSPPESAPQGRAPRIALQRIPVPPHILAAYRFPPKGQEPKIVFERELLAFGELAEGTEVNATFPFVNQGKGPLVIYTIKPGCACTIGSLEVEGKHHEYGTPIPVGAKGKIAIAFRTSGIQGEKHADIDVLTNDPSRPDSPAAELGFLTLKLTARVVRFFTWEGGPAIDFGRFAVAKPQERTVVLKNIKDAPFEIVNIEGIGNGLAASAQPEDEKRTRWKIQVATGPQLARGTLSKKLFVRTHGDSPLANSGSEIYVGGMPRGSIDVNPPLGMRFQVIPRGQSKSLALSLINESGGPWSIGPVRWVETQSAAGEPPEKWRDAPAEVTQHLKTEIVVIRENQQSDVKVTVDEGMPAKNFSLTLAIPTGVADGPATITIPVTGIVR